MSLIDEYSDEFIIMTKTIEDDGYGGTTTSYKEGLTITAALGPASQNEVTVADAMGEKITHVLVVSKGVALDYHDVLKRKADSMIFRVTNTDGGTETPGSSSLDMKKYRLETWELPTEVENG